jgi:hypothetical protein
MKVLHRAAGRFTVLKGTDKILHFVEAIPNAIRTSTDIYEVVLFRALRRSVRDGHVTSINPDGSSFYLLLASMLHRLANRATRPINVLEPVVASYRDAVHEVSWPTSKST